MSTRAFYQFNDELGNHNVYVHSDGYPSGAYSKIMAAIPLAWSFPRFEADEFAASFVAGNKEHSGNVRLYKTGSYQKIAPPDIAWLYKITFENENLKVVAFSVFCDWKTDEWEQEKRFEGDIETMKEWIAREPFGYPPED